MVNTKVELSGIELDNPLIPASGTFGFGYEFAELYDINILGSFSFKGTTKEPRFGNPTPRIAECYSGMINSVGLQNPGIEKVISEELPKLRQCFYKPVVANISGFSLEEYVYCCEKIDKEDQVGITLIDKAVALTLGAIVAVAGGEGLNLICHVHLTLTGQHINHFAAGDMGVHADGATGLEQTAQDLALAVVEHLGDEGTLAAVEVLQYGIGHLVKIHLHK